MQAYYERVKLQNVVGMISYGLSDGFEERKKQLPESPLNRTNLPNILPYVLENIDIRGICGLVVECTNKRFRWPGLLRVMDLGQVVDLAYPEPARLVSHDELIDAARRQKPEFYRSLEPQFKNSRFAETWLFPDSEMVVTDTLD